MALGRDGDKRLVGRASLAAQVEADAGAGVARHIEHQFEPGARTNRKLVIEWFERLARLAVHRDDERSCAVDRDGRQARSRGAAETQPHARARRGLELQWRGCPIGEDDTAPAPASAANSGIGEIVLDPSAGV